MPASESGKEAYIIETGIREFKVDTQIEYNRVHQRLGQEDNHKSIVNTARV